jgi:catechol 2,3-dioxygenase-like lactoylglutathione lyase family enzyme
MNLHSGGFLITVTDLDLSTKFYCEAMELRVQASDGTSVMLAPDDNATHPWLLALRRVGGKTHLSGGSVGIRALFFRIDLADLDDLELRLRALDGFHERHDGEFYEMVSAYSPDRNALGFWAPLPNAPLEGPSFVPPSIYFLD